MILKKKKIRNDIKSFLRLYANRPIKDNSGGVLFGHAFALHYFLKKLKPKLIVESGTFKGQSSWLMRQTCPKSKIVTLDIYPNKLEYKNKKIKYLYKDFTLCDWSKIPKNSLIFFDDHQNALERIIYAKWAGFKYVIFEDNDENQVDFYTIRQVLSGKGFQNNIYSFKKNYLKYFYLRIFHFFKSELKKVLITKLKFFDKIIKNHYYKHNIFEYKDIKKNFHDRNILLNNILKYVEFPSMIKEKNFKSKSKNISKNNYLFKNLDEALKFDKNLYSIKKELSYYNNIVLIVLK